MNRFLAFAALAVGGYFAFAAFQPEYSIEVPENEIVDGFYDSPENMKVNPDDFESGADVDFDLGVYFRDLFERVSAYSEAEINYFVDIWGQ